MTQPRNAIFILGLAAATTTLTLIGLTLVLCARDSWRSRRQNVAMERLRVAGDREWSDEEQASEEAKVYAFGRTLDEIRDLPIASPWEVA